MTYQMAAMGLAQTALEYPELRAEHLAAIDVCIDGMTSDKLKTFDRDAWGEDPLAKLEGGRGHAAYLGYLNLALSFRRVLDPHGPSAQLSDRVTQALVQRLQESPMLLIETYPREIYAVDNAAVVGSIALYDQAMGTDHSKLLGQWTERCRRDYVDKKTGLLYQAVDPHTGAPADAPRGSGTCLAIYYLSFVRDPIAKELFASVKANATDSVLGFGTIREYPRGVTPGKGDIDSGPVIFGQGVTATGFALAGARIFSDRELYRGLYSTAALFGAPSEHDGICQFAAGGPLGNAIMLAMLSAQSPAAMEEYRGSRSTTQAGFSPGK